MSFRSCVRIGAWLAIACASIAQAPPTQATVITVTSLSDAVAADGVVTLREAILAANTNAPVNEAPAGEGASLDTITFTVSGVVILTSPLPQITGMLMIDGPEVPARIVVRRDLAGAHIRIFDIASGATVTLKDLTIREGWAPVGEDGGGILNRGDLTVERCDVRNNRTEDNRSGGGIFSNNGASRLTILASTVANNYAGFGGGIFSQDPLGATLRNSTVSSNVAGTAGGIRSFSAMSVTNCTITLNQCNVPAITTGNAGGVFNNQPLTLKNTIIAGNFGNAAGNVNQAPDIRIVNAPVNYIGLGHNLFGSTLNSNLPAAATGDQYNVNPLLGALQDNKGQTRTHALPLASPAVDKGASAVGVFNDQRGSLRPVDYPSIPPAADGNNSDIGAYERSGDIDADGIEDFIDNCKFAANPGQEDGDADGVGDVCDNCPTVPNPPVFRGVGDPMQSDIDMDGIGDPCDNCPTIFNPGQEDADGDDIGDVCDNCIAVSNPGQEDSDLDGIGDACQPHPPVAVNDAFSTPEDTTLNVSAPGVLANDSDPNPGDTLTAVLVANAAHGVVTLNPNGSFSYTPVLNYNGPDAFTYRARDNGGLLSNIATVSLTVTPVNDPPVAVNDAYATNEDTTLAIGAAQGVLINDTDVDGAGVLTAVLVAPTTNGVLTLNPNGSFTYIPAANFFGIDSFTYRAQDAGGLLSNIATVTITVNADNDPPIAVNDAFSTNEDTVLTITAPGILANDTDVDGPPPITAVLVTSTSNGVLSLNATGSFVYTPNPDFNGIDSFTYRARDGANFISANPATVTITVNPVNDAPVAVNDVFSTDEDTPLTITPPGVLANDSDIDGPAPLTAVLVSTTTHGVLVLNANGSFNYTPAPNYNGPDSFTYRARDGAAAQSNVATVSLTVNPINDPPVALNDAYSTNEDTNLVVNSVLGVLANDSDPDGPAPLTAVLVSSTTHGALSLASNGSFTYTPTSNYNGPDAFTYRARDGSGLESAIVTATITVNPVNDPPVAVDDAFSTQEDTLLTITAPGLLANDTDVDGAPPTAALLTSPVTSGTLSLNLDGSFTYTPAADFIGIATFTYRCRDAGNLQSLNVATVTINITPDNDPPVAVNDAFIGAEDTALSIPATGVLSNDSDIDGPTPLTTVLVSTTTNGALTLAADGSFLYTPNANFNGGDTFTYRARDGFGGLSNVATVSITINPANDPPVANNDSYNATEDTLLTVPVGTGILANDTDIDGPPPLTAILVTPPSHGNLSISGNGSFSYQPALNYNGPDSFTYRCRDAANAESNIATVTININPANDPPVAVNDDFSTMLNTQLIVGAPGVLLNDTDIDGPPPVAAILTTTTSSGTLSLFLNGGFTYQPNPGFVGVDSFTYRARDAGNLQSLNPATVTITVNPTNRPPEAVCRNVIIDARDTCPPSFSIVASDVDGGSTDPDMPDDSITLSVNLTGPFPIGVTPVVLTVTDSFGLTDTCNATVTVLANDCNANGVPDSCEIAGGSAADCNLDGIPDLCQCFWDNGMPPAVPLHTDGQLSHEGGGAPDGGKAADDFYLEPGYIHLISGFSGQMLTNSVSIFRRARLEFYEDCNGLPVEEPFKVFTEFTILATAPAPNGFTMVTYAFDLCDEVLWLDGGKTYWVSLIGLADHVTNDLSYWAASDGLGDPFRLLGSVPARADGVPLFGDWDEFDYFPWEPIVTDCCIGCVNLAFKLSGESCKIVWDNGPPDIGPSRGGTPSGANGATTSRTADNFVIAPCEDQELCFIETYIWTNCDPVDGFLEIYENFCDDPVGEVIFSAVPTKVEDLDVYWTYNWTSYRLHRLIFTNLNFTLQRGKTYYLSTGAHSGGNFISKAFFAYNTRYCDACDLVRITPGQYRDIAPIETPWTVGSRDYSFRIAVKGPPFFTVLPPTGGGSTPTPCAADVNESGSIGVEDIFEFLSAWFAGCP